MLSHLSADPRAAYFSAEDIQSREQEIAALLPRQRQLAVQALKGLTAEELLGLERQNESNNPFVEEADTAALRALLALPVTLPVCGLQQQLTAQFTEDFAVMQSLAPVPNLQQQLKHAWSDSPLGDLPPQLYRRGSETFAVWGMTQGGSHLDKERRDLLQLQLDVAAHLLQHPLKGAICWVDSAAGQTKQEDMLADMARGAEVLARAYAEWSKICQGMRPEVAIGAELSSELKLPAEMEVPQFSADTLALGGKVSQYQIPTNGEVARPSQAVLQEVEELSALFTAWRIMGIEAEAVSDALGAALRRLVPVQALGNEVETVDLAGARLKVQRAWDKEAVERALRDKLSATGLNEEEVAETLAHPNYNTPAGFSGRLLAEKIKEKFGVDIYTDPEFASCIDTPAQPRLETRLALLRDLDSEHAIDYNALIDTSRSGVKIELARAPVAGPGRQAREVVHQQLREAVRGQVEQVGRRYVRQLRTPTADAPKRKPRSRR